MSRLGIDAPHASMDGWIEEMLNERPPLVRQFDHRTHARSLQVRSVRLNGTDEGIRARTIGYRLSVVVTEPVRPIPVPYGVRCIRVADTAARRFPRPSMPVPRATTPPPRRVAERGHRPPVGYGVNVPGPGASHAQKVTVSWM
jgi:hypothetical protein